MTSETAIARTGVRQPQNRLDGWVAPAGLTRLSPMPVVHIIDATV